VSGLFDAAQLPLALMLSADRVPNRKHAFDDALTQAGSPDPVEFNRYCMMSSCPYQLVWRLVSASIPIVVASIMDGSPHWFASTQPPYGT
jgi:hypothetical protein